MSGACLSYKEDLVNLLGETDMLIGYKSSHEIEYYTNENTEELNFRFVNSSCAPLSASMCASREERERYQQQGDRNYANMPFSNEIYMQQSNNIHQTEEQREQQLRPDFGNDQPVSEHFDQESTHMEGVTESNRERKHVRYTKVEEAALVHAKVHMDIKNKFGDQLDPAANYTLTELYRHYLSKLDPCNFKKYVEREETAILRKYKSIKQKLKEHGGNISELLDSTIDNGIWTNLLQSINTPVSSNTNMDYKE